MFLEYPLVPMLFKFKKKRNASKTSVIAPGVKDRNGCAELEIADLTKPVIRSSQIKGYDKKGKRDLCAVNL